MHRLQDPQYIVLLAYPKGELNRPVRLCHLWDGQDPSLLIRYKHWTDYWNVQLFTGNGDVSVSVKYFWMGSITINNQSIIKRYANYKYLVYPFCHILKMLHLFRTYEQFWPFDHKYHKYTYLYLHFCDIWASDLCSVDTQDLIGWSHDQFTMCIKSKSIAYIRTAKLHTSSFLRFRLQVHSKILQAAFPRVQIKKKLPLR